MACMVLCAATVCPSTTSDCILGGSPFRFAGESKAHDEVAALRASLQLRPGGGTIGLAQ